MWAVAVRGNHDGWSRGGDTQNDPVTRVHVHTNLTSLLAQLVQPEVPGIPLLEVCCGPQRIHIRVPQRRQQFLGVLKHTSPTRHEEAR